MIPFSYLFELLTKREAVDEVQDFINAGGNINAPGAEYRDGHTLLITAVYYGRTKTLTLLIKAGADLEATSIASHMTALSYAVALGPLDTGVTKLLLEAGADANTKSFQDWTPLFYAAAWGKLADAKLLLESGTDVFAKSSQDKTALDIARERGADVLADYLDAYMQEHTPYEPSESVKIVRSTLLAKPSFKLRR